MDRFHPHPSDFDVAVRVKELRSHKVIGVSMAAKKLWAKLEPILEEAGWTGAVLNDPKMLRQWSDATGAFQVQAKFIKLDGDKVVLERNDGKMLNVPLSKLSESDQTFLKTIREQEDAANDPANPFR